MCGQTCDQFVDSSTKTISLYMVRILVGLVHIYSLESTVKRESFRIFARNDIKINFPNEHAWQSVLVGTRSLLRVRRCVVASLIDLSVPKGRAKASKLLNHQLLGRPHMACSQLGDNPLAPNQSFRLIFGGGAKIFHSIFFSGFIYDHCHLEYP